MLWILIHCFLWCFYSQYLKSLDILKYLFIKLGVCCITCNINAFLLIEVFRFWITRFYCTHVFTYSKCSSVDLSLKMFFKKKKRVWNNKVFDTIYVIHNWSSVYPESSKCFNPIEFRITTFKLNLICIYRNALLLIRVLG